MSYTVRLWKWKPKLVKGRPRSNLKNLGKDGKYLPMENYLTVTVPIKYIVHKLNLKMKFYKNC